MHIVRQRIRQWVSGNYGGLWSEVCKVAECFRPSRRKGGGKETSSLHLNNANRAHRAVEDGQYRKAIQFLTSDGVASVSDDVYSEMVSKHPQASQPVSISTPAPCPVEIHEQCVVKALKSFPVGTAPGPSGLRASHLKEASSCPSPRISNNFLKSISKFMNLLCSGDVPAIIVPHLNL